MGNDRAVLGEMPKGQPLTDRSGSVGGTQKSLGGDEDVLKEMGQVRCPEEWQGKGG